MVKIEYHDKNGKKIKFDCQDVELFDNTPEYTGYWSAERVTYKDFRLTEKNRSQFIFYTDQHIRLEGRGAVQSNGQNGYSIIGEGELVRK
ncbi:hypothetical protein [Salipaludibacillus aurantiacus]|uniref:hypothetical protein n=1 Tax=Salipaludibacillus aurantiacus TaxID=1601833 RepID=UPI0015A7089F|nr:hypothetical protein [Salipaludibacillus aurantiacus]